MSSLLIHLALIGTAAAADLDVDGVTVTLDGTQTLSLIHI